MTKEAPLDAVIVGSLDLGESDRLIRLLTPTEGRVAVVARAARSSARRYGGALEIGNAVQIERGRGKGSLRPIARVERIAGPDIARTELERIVLVPYGCEVCASLAPEGAPAEKLWGLLRVWLATLEGPHAPGPVARLALEAKALTFAGLAPALVRCARCGETLTDPVVFDNEAGGAIHARCGGGRPVSLDFLAEVEAARRSPLADLAQRPVPSGPTWLLADFLQHQIGRALHSRSTVEHLG